MNKFNDGDSVLPARELLELFQSAKSLVSSEEFESSFGKYQIRDILSDNQHAMVAVADDPVLNRLVVLKINTASGENHEVLAEGRALAAINHPNVVKILDLQQLGEGDVLVLECINGKTLEEFCLDNSLTETMVFEIGQQIAEGIQEIHRQGLLHLDLKPSNIMITREGVVKIVDFGLARRINDVSFGEVMGTPGYLAPERIKDIPEEIGVKTDIFGLGGILFYMLEKRAPFQAETYSETIANSFKATSGFSKPTRLRTSARLRKLIAACLAETPSKRPASANAVIEKLSGAKRFLKLRTMGMLAALLFCAVTLLAFGFPGWVSSLASKPDNPPAPVVVFKSADRRAEKPDVEEELPPRRENLQGIVFAELFDESTRKARFFGAKGRFEEGAQHLRKIASDLNTHFPNADNYHTELTKLAELFTEFATLDDEIQQDVSQSARLMNQGWASQNTGNLPGTDKSMEAFSEAYDLARFALGENHGWTIICQSRMLMDQLQNGDAKYPNLKEIQAAADRLRNFFGVGGIDEYELCFRFARRLLIEADKAGMNLKESESLTEIHTACEKSAMIAQDYFLGWHQRNLHVMAELGNLRFYRMQDCAGGAKVYQEMVKMCEDNLGFESLPGLQALIGLAEYQLKNDSKSESRKMLLRLMKTARKMIHELEMMDEEKFGPRRKSVQHFLDQAEKMLKTIPN